MFTDRHAYLTAATYYADLGALDQIDWEILRARDFKRDLNDLGKVERYQAEALIRDRVPIEVLLGLGCAGNDTEAQLKQMVADAGAELEVAAKPDWYF